MSLKSTLAFGALSLTFVSPIAYAADTDECKIVPFPRIDSVELSNRQTPLAEGEALLSAEQMSRDGEVTVLQGDARLIDNQQRISADKIIYDQPNDRVLLQDHVNYQSDNLDLQSTAGEFQPDAGSGSFENNKFQMPQQNASGSADKINIFDNQHSELTKVKYSTCPPQNRSWEMSASKLTLDQESNTGEAYNVALKFKQVPFFYFPYINFALEGRKTGLLPPTFSSSERNGTDIAIPWYWNIAPEYDATITPRFIQNRGIMLSNEFRFLTPYGGGVLNTELLPNDKLTDNDRRFSRFTHHYKNNRWYGSVDINSASDDNYLNDLGSTVVDSGSARLEQRIENGYRTETTNVKLNLQQYQELTNSPIYQRLPQITLAWNPKHDAKWKFSLNSELTRFEHVTSSQTTGKRLDLNPVLSYPTETESGFIRPKLTLRHTQYQLDNSTEQPTRSMPIVSIDSGLFFDRYFDLGEQPYQQTLEPRLYYLYSPYIDQSSYPNFDTSTVAFSWNQLFQQNRFSGADRQIDANQLSFALSSRFIENQSGIERLRLSIGKISQFSTPKVNLGTSWENSNYKNYITEVAFKPYSEWQLSHSQQFTPEGNSALSSSAIKYDSPKLGRASINYRNDEATNLQQSDLVANLKIAQRWHLIGRNLYDINQQQSLDTVLGLEYESCCWIGRILARDEWKSDTLQLERSYLFNIEFKGLASMGDDLESILGSGIIAP